MAMSLTRLSATGGVDYLVRTVMSGDRSVGPQSPSAVTGYYLASGNPAGVWWGRGAQAANIAPGDLVTGEGAERLFKHAKHPLTGEPLGAAPRATSTQAPVAGFDLTFTIPKSIAVLWAVADRSTQVKILAAHHRAVDQALEHVEDRVAQTRSGRGGVAVEEVDGLVVAKFDHFTSRDGDPHPHVHAVVANRVRRSRDGKWLTLDSRALHKAAVAASELHENLILDEVARTLGWQFVERDDPARTSKAVVMDVDGVPAEVVDKFSGRARAIKQAQAELTREFTHTYGREPNRVEAARIHRDAWRATRRAKDDEVEPLATSMSRWRTQLQELGWTPGTLLAQVRIGTSLLGMRGAADEHLVDQSAQLVLDQMIDHLAQKLTKDGGVDPSMLGSTVTGAREMIAAAALGNVVTARSTWSRANVRAEVERLTRTVRCASTHVRAQLVDAITDRALGACVQITEQRYRPVPDTRLVAHGSSVFDDPSLQLFTHTRTLNAERSILDAAGTVFDPGLGRDQAQDLIEGISDHIQANGGHGLGPDQRAAAIAAISEPSALSAIIGPAGTGKTSTMRAVRTAWEHTHGPGTVIGLTTSAQAAAVLGDELGAETNTVAKWLYESVGDGATRRVQAITALQTALERVHGRPGAARIHRALTQHLALQASYRVRPGQLLILDEASMTGTYPMAELVRQAHIAGAKVLLVGDPDQLGAPEAGGVLARLARQGHAHQLTGVWRFTNEWERSASLQLRRGDEEVIETYDEHGRIAHGSDEDMIEGAYQAALADITAGHDTLLIAGTNAAVRDLNTRFTLDRRAAGAVDTTALARLRADQDAGIGDVIVARKVDRQTRDSGGDFIRNGTLGTVTHVHTDGSITIRRHDNQATVRLDAQYAAENVDLGYALTAHRAQGSTVDRAHVAVPTRAMMPRELFYVAMTRGRSSNMAWIGEETTDEHGTKDEATTAEIAHRAHKSLVAEDDRLTWQMRLAGILQHTGTERSATQVVEDEHERTHSLDQLHAERDHLISLTRPPVDDTVFSQALALIEHRFGPAPEVTNDRDDAGASRRALARHLARLHHDGHEMSDLVDKALSARQTTDALDLPALVHWRLTHIMNLDAAVRDINMRDLATSDPHLAATLETNQQLIDDREAALRALPATEPWITVLPSPAAVGEQAWGDLVTAVRIYRDQHNITTADPVGPEPDTRARDQHQQWAAIGQRIQQTRPQRRTPTAPSTQGPRRSGPTM